MKTPESESLFNKVAGLRPATLLKRDSDARASCGFCEVLENIFLFCKAPPVATSVRFIQIPRFAHFKLHKKDANWEVLQAMLKDFVKEFIVSLFGKGKTFERVQKLRFQTFCIYNNSKNCLKKLHLLSWKSMQSTERKSSEIKEGKKSPLMSFLIAITKFCFSFLT